MAEQKYYKWSLKWSFNNCDEHVFYKENNCGYTKGIENAGVYTADELSKCEGIIETKEDYKEALKKGEYHPVYAVPIDKVDLLGKRMTVFKH